MKQERILKKAKRKYPEKLDAMKIGDTTFLVDTNKIRRTKYQIKLTDKNGKR